MTKLRNSLVLAAVAALLCIPMRAAADTTVKAKLVEQNGSGVSGTVRLTALGDGALKVVIHSEGLVPGQPQPVQHRPPFLGQVDDRGRHIDLGQLHPHAALNR